jgi:chloramphenicol 3-O-phosphotransferase
MGAPEVIANWSAGHRAMLISGPAAVGKTTVAQLFAESRPQPTVLLQHDEIRAFVRSGRAEEAGGFTPEARRQWALAMQVCVAAMREYLLAGFDCVIDAYSPATDEQWRADLPAGADFQSFVLMAPLEIVLDRNRGRTANRMRDSAVRLNYSDFSYSPMAGAVLIDATTATPCELATLIERRACWPTSVRAVG